MKDGYVTGSFRLTLDSEAGVPADEFYPFREHLPAGAKVMGAGMLCISSEHREASFISGLIMMASYYALTHDVTHVIAPINPAIAKLLTRRVGFQIIGEEFTDPHTGVAILPLLLDTSDLKDFFLNFVKKNKLLDFLGDYERWFYQEGEYVIRAGETGQEAFILIDGKAHIRHPGKETAFAELEAGEIFGELALLTEGPRSADVVAATDLQVMRLSKEVFMNRYLKSPGEALHLLRIMGERNLSLINRLEKSSSPLPSQTKA